MHENVPFIELRSEDCKLVRLTGGRADGVTTAVHRLAEFTDRPQGRYRKTWLRTAVYNEELWQLAEGVPA